MWSGTAQPLLGALALLAGLYRTWGAIVDARSQFRAPDAAERAVRFRPMPRPVHAGARAPPLRAAAAPPMIEPALLPLGATAPLFTLPPRPAFLPPLEYGTLRGPGVDGQVVAQNPPLQSRCHTSKAYGFMFAHITKCGGSAILNNIKDLLCVAASKAKGCSLTDAEGRITYGCGDLTSDRLFSFSFVRNPWDRAVSDWGYGLKRELATCAKARPCEERIARGYCSFRDYIFRNASVPKGRRCGYHTETQWQQAFTKDKLPSFNFLGRLEAFERDFATVLGKVDPSGKLLAAYRKSGFTMHNDSPRKDYRDMYDVATQARVAQDHSVDIGLLKYSFEDGTRRNELSKMVKRYNDGAAALDLAPTL